MAVSDPRMQGERGGFLSVWRPVAFAVILAMALWAHPVAAQQPLSDPLARDLKAQGDQAMAQGQYEAALDAYERATAIEPAPTLLYNRARALQALRRFSEALDHFEAFRQEASEDVKAKVPGLDELIQRLRSQIGLLSLQVNVPGAQVTVRGEEAGVAPFSQPLRFNAGPAQIVVKAKGYQSFAKAVQLTGGATLALTVDLRPASASGLLRVNSHAAGAEVLVDGRLVGMVPVEVEVRAGHHEVLVRHPHKKTSVTQVIIDTGQIRELSVELQGRPILLQRWWFWTGVGVVVLSGAAVTAALLTERPAHSGDIPPGQISAPLLFSF